MRSALAQPHHRRLRLFATLLAVSSVASAPSAGVQDAHRVAVVYNRGTYSIAGITALSTALAPSDDLPAGTSSGFWYELRAADDRLLYRRIVEDPLRMVYDGPDENSWPGEPATLVRDEGIPSVMLLYLVIPRAVDGDRLVLRSSPLLRGHQEQAAAEVARLVLDVP